MLESSRIRPTRSLCFRVFCLSLALLPSIVASQAAVITLPHLLKEMTDPAAVTRFPDPEYECRQASSYNRMSTHRDQPDQTTSGWFADSDGVGFLRKEQINGRTEYVLLDHEGPGCLTKLWTPFFYYDFNNRTGPNVRIYLDGSDQAVLDESLIRLVRGEGSLKPPLAHPTARAGDCYVPMPFARRCLITTTEKPFYYLINYRTYPPGTSVETFTLAAYRAARTELAEAAEALTPPLVETEIPKNLQKQADLPPGQTLRLRLPSGPRALSHLRVDLPDAPRRPRWLRSTVLAMSFDGEETVWCPIGDFFCSADSLHPFQTWQRTATSSGNFHSRWRMPYRQRGEIRIVNLGQEAISVRVQAKVMLQRWDTNSLHFHARWRPDDVVPGHPFQDWNFIDIRGRGIYVGDAWTVLNPQGGWWGEGDEKIYVDDAWDRGFPTHFGTGSEDYYGWAGGENPTRRDEFSTPFLANVRVGGLNADTIGYNICTRTRSLDAIPFRSRLVFDMESSFGVDIRHPWDLLGYSAVTFWYAAPGATHNRPAQPVAAAKPIVSLQGLRESSQRIKQQTSAPPRR